MKTIKYFLVIIILLLLLIPYIQPVEAQVSSYPSFQIYESGWVQTDPGVTREFTYGWEGLPATYQVYVKNFSDTDTSGKVTPYMELKDRCVRLFSIDATHLTVKNNCGIRLSLKGTAIYWGVTP